MQLLFKVGYEIMRKAEDFLKCEPIDLCNIIHESFNVELLQEIESAEDMKKASSLNLQLSAYETFFSTLLSFAEIETRRAKRELTKTEYENMVDRKKIIQNKLDSLKHQREALSRSVTIYIKTLEELKYADKM